MKKAFAVGALCAAGQTALTAAAYRERGRAAAGKGEYDLAIAWFGEALRLDPEDADAYYNRGNTVLQEGRARAGPLPTTAKR